MDRASRNSIGVVSAFRIITVGATLHIKDQFRSPISVLSTLVTPIMYATLAVYLFRQGGHADALLYACLAAGLMSMFSTVLFGAGNSIQMQRHRGVLEYVVVAPTSLAYPLLATSLATGVVGSFSVLATLAWGAGIYSIPLEIASPVKFVATMLVMLASLSTFGLALSTVFISMRNANAIFNSLDYPAWMLSGMLVSISTLPTPLQWVSTALPSRWGVEAMAASLTGDPVGIPTGLCLSLGILYLGFAAAGVRAMERRARVRGTLAFA